MAELRGFLPGDPGFSGTLSLDLEGVTLVNRRRSATKTVLRIDDDTARNPRRLRSAPPATQEIRIDILPSDNVQMRALATPTSGRSFPLRLREWIRSPTAHFGASSRFVRWMRDLIWNLTLLLNVVDTEASLWVPDIAVGLNARIVPALPQLEFAVALLGGWLQIVNQVQIGESSLLTHRICTAIPAAICGVALWHRLCTPLRRRLRDILTSSLLSNLVNSRLPPAWVRVTVGYS
jgi:hypothetical protein